jgi:purine-binding chemotaxis protein CheW
MNASLQLVLFRLDDQRFALALEAVERIVRAAEITPLPNAPSIVLGVLDVEGRVLPVLNLRRRLGLPERDLAPNDQFVLARTATRSVALVVDEALGLIELPPDGIASAEQIAPGLDPIRGVIQLPDGMALIHDLDRFLSLDEERVLDEALSTEVAHAG